MTDCIPALSVLEKEGTWAEGNSGMPGAGGAENPAGSCGHERWSAPLAACEAPDSPLLPCLSMHYIQISLHSASVKAFLEQCAGRAATGIVRSLAWSPQGREHVSTACLRRCTNPKGSLFICDHSVPTQVSVDMNSHNQACRADEHLHVQEHAQLQHLPLISLLDMKTAQKLQYAQDISFQRIPAAHLGMQQGPQGCCNQAARPAAES